MEDGTAELRITMLCDGVVEALKVKLASAEHGREWPGRPGGGRIVRYFVECIAHLDHHLGAHP
jgi:hypothetical protein